MRAVAKTVAILTHHEAFNFGATLQAFALQRVIEEMGYRCLVMDCRESSGAYRLLRAPVGREKMRHDLLMLWNLRSYLRARGRFHSFRRKYLAVTRRPLWSVADMGREEQSFDAYVSGSDQVWHPGLIGTKLGQFFFQDFSASGRRIAYAPSFGVAELPERRLEAARRLIGRFEYLSAREDTGREIIRGLTGRVVEQVLDPTLLLGAATYDGIAAAVKPPGPYILLYPMLWNENLAPWVARAKRQLGLPVVAVLPQAYNPRQFSFADVLVLDAGPGEFLGWIKGAEYILTSSFHGTCFSIVYRKNFTSIPGSDTGTRQHSLLRCLGLESRLATGAPTLVGGGGPGDPVDYADVEVRLVREAGRSRDYLRRALPLAV